MTMRRKIWLGLGTAILAAPQGTARADMPQPPLADLIAPAGTPAASRLVIADSRPHGTHAAKAAAGGEGEGGEGAVGEGAGGEGEGGEGEGGEGEGGAARLEPALAFYRDIQLLRGHLLVGDELVKEGRWAEALPHFLHPAEEIYGEIRGDLKTYDVPPFLTALKALAQTVKAKNREAYAAALKTVEERLAAADKGVRAKEQNWPYFTAETALETLNTAADEYEEAVAGGRIRNVVEYQDARGFVWQAERLISGVADEFAKKDPDAMAAIRASFADLKQAWPGPMPPQKPVKDLSQVLSDISKIELQLGRFR